MTIITRKRLALFAALFSPCLFGGLSKTAMATEQDDGVWAVFTSTDTFPAGDTTSRWHYWFDAQARYFDLGGGINQYLVRPGVGYDINDNLSAWVGYARLRARNRSGNVADENRYWQQLSWTAGRWNNGTLSLRTRLEQRSLNIGNDLGVVLRVLAKYVRPIGNDGKRYLSVGIEPFVDLKDTDWGGEAGLGQNRGSIGVGWRVSDKLIIEAGYINQFIWVDGGEDRMNHLAVIHFKMKL